MALYYYLLLFVMINHYYLWRAVVDAVRLKCQLLVFWFQERRWKEHHALPSVVHLFLCNCSFEGIFDSNDPDKN